jgi:hypothetical protein
VAARYGHNRFQFCQTNRSHHAFLDDWIVMNVQPASP